MLFLAPEVKCFVFVAKGGVFFFCFKTFGAFFSFQEGGCFFLGEWVYTGSQWRSYFVGQIGWVRCGPRNGGAVTSNLCTGLL